MDRLRTKQAASGYPDTKLPRQLKATSTEWAFFSQADYFRIRRHSGRVSSIGTGKLPGTGPLRSQRDVRLSPTDSPRGPSRLRF
jgi:hypothetical protein